MSFEDEIASMEAAIGNVVATTLSNIRKKLSGSNDFVLVDTNDNFKTLFLNTAKNKIDYAYNAYLMQAKFRNLIGTSNDNITTETELMPQPSEQSSFENEKGSTEVHSASDNQKFLVSSDISPMEKNRQLQLQNELQNTLIIFGLPLRDGNQEWLLSSFISLCERLSVPTDATEIESTQSVGDAFTVTFHKQYKKDEVLTQFHRRNNLRSDQVVKLLPGEISRWVRVLQRDTPFYRGMTMMAQFYTKSKRLYCYRTTNRGLGLMFTRRDKELVYVQSQYELQEQVSLYESMKEKSQNSKINKKNSANFDAE